MNILACRFTISKIDGEESASEVPQATLDSMEILMRTSAKAATAAVVTILAGSALQVTTAGAALAEWKDCPDRYVCLWGDSNYAGRYRFQPEHDLFVSNIGSAMNDLTTSIWNRTGRKVCFYNDINYQRQLLCLDAGGSSANVGSGANDRISSFQPF